jgi:hypothetical protein
MNARQLAVANLIRSVVAAWTGGVGNADPLISFAMRESGLTPTAVGDVENGEAAKSWKRNKAKFVKAANPWAHQDSLWEASLGLYQHMPSNWINFWDLRADPRVFFDPIVSTIVAARMWNRAVSLGAKNVIDVRMYWAFGPQGLKRPKDGPQYQSRIASERSRWKKLGLSGDPATVSAASFRLGAFGTGPQADQNARVAALREGTGIPEIPDDQKKSGSLIVLALFAAALWGLG